MGGNQKEQLVKILVPPEEFIEDLIYDIEGIGIPRGA